MQATGRVDMYAGIHKTMRLFMSDTLCQVGSSDPGSDSEVAAMLGLLERLLALFVADDVQHMHVEETAHDAVLWAHYSDDELMAIEQAIVASIPPPATSRHGRATRSARSTA